MPTYIAGFSRGTVDAAYVARYYPELIQGIVLASGVYKNQSPRANQYALQNMAGNILDVEVLLVHHELDKCAVTQYEAAMEYFDNLSAPRKSVLVYSGGRATGNSCGPLNHHGFEDIGPKVARDIAGWIKNAP